MNSYLISEEALKDIDHIWIYTAEYWSVEQADRYYNLIFDEIEYISQNFEVGRDFGHIRKGYRCSNVKSHLIFYKKDKNENIEIIRVLHEQMDIKNQLKIKNLD